MDVRTEQDYQQRIAALEACVVDLETQLAQGDAAIAALQQQVTDLSKQVADLLAQVARLSKNSSNSSKPPSPDGHRDQTTATAPAAGRKAVHRRPEGPSA